MSSSTDESETGIAWCTVPMCRAAAAASADSSYASTSKPTVYVRTSPAPRALHERSDGARVEPAAQERADGHVRHEVRLDRLLEQRPEALAVLRERAPLAGGERERPVALDVDPTVLEEQRVPGLEEVHLLERARGGGHVQVKEVRVDGRGAHATLDEPCREERLELRAEDERAARAGPDERLDAQAVACNEQRPIAVVPDREGEHPREALDAAAPPLEVRLEDDLGVAVGLEASAARGELADELAAVVDLAVEDEHHPPRLVEHGLQAPLDVADGEPIHPEGEAHLPVAAPRDRGRGRGSVPAKVVYRQAPVGDDPRALTVGAAVSQGPVHDAHELQRAVRGVRRVPDDASDRAHVDEHA
jgi:hypothetical protein